MKIIWEDQLEIEEVDEEGYKETYQTVVIGPDEDSDNIRMELYRIESGGETALHKHPREHLIRIEKGEGVVFSEIDGKFKVSPGQNIFIPADEEHQFQNPYSDPFEFVIITPEE